MFAMISGFLKPDSGSVRYGGRDLVGMKPHEICLIGVVRTFQVVQPFANLSVRENIAVGAHARIRSRADALGRAAEIGGRLGMGKMLDQPAGALTVAGRKRLAFVCTGALWLPVGLHAGGALVLMAIRPLVRYSGPAWLVGASIFPYAGVAGAAALILLTINIWLCYGGLP